jgi:hypothetical protein
MLTQKHPVKQSPNRTESRALQNLVNYPSHQGISDLLHHHEDSEASALRSLNDSGRTMFGGKVPRVLINGSSAPSSSRLCKFDPLILLPGGSLTRFLWSRPLCAMDKKPTSSKSNLSPQERIEILRTELESIKASTAKHKWEMLAMEMQDIKDDLTDELQAGLKDVANLIGNLGKRLVALETQVEGLTTALGKISEVTAEASKKDH